MNLIFRTIEKHDLSHLQQLMEDLGYPTEIKELNEAVDEVKKRGGDIFLADDNGTILGCICVIIDVRLAEGVYAEIVSLVVDPGARGRGIGKKLVENAEKWASKRVKKIRVRANEVRKDAHLFYNALGYNCVKTQKIFFKKL